MGVISENIAVVILAAGKGTRMKLEIPKVLVEIAGRPLLAYVLSAIEDAGISRQHVNVVVGHQYEKVVSYLDGRYAWVLQETQLGTGHAVLAAREKLAAFSGTVMVLYGDVPLITADIVKQLYDSHMSARADCTVLTTEVGDPHGYGRIVRDAEGNMVSIIEEKEASEKQKRITEINTGLYCFEKNEMFKALDLVNNDNAKGEYYLTDVVRIMISQGNPVCAVHTPESIRVLGVNTQQELEHAAAVVKG